MWRISTGSVFILFDFWPFVKNEILKRRAIFIHDSILNLQSVCPFHLSLDISLGKSGEWGITLNSMNMRILSSKMILLFCRELIMKSLSKSLANIRRVFNLYLALNSDNDMGLFGLQNQFAIGENLIDFSWQVDLSTRRCMFSYLQKLENKAACCGFSAMLSWKIWNTTERLIDFTVAFVGFSVFISLKFPLHPKWKLAHEDEIERQLVTTRQCFSLGGKFCHLNGILKSKNEWKIDAKRPIRSETRGEILGW